jgi:hypothetical protein
VARRFERTRGLSERPIIHVPCSERKKRVCVFVSNIFCRVRTAAYVSYLDVCVGREKREREREREERERDLNVRKLYCDLVLAKCPINALALSKCPTSWSTRMPPTSSYRWWCQRQSVLCIVVSLGLGIHVRGYRLTRIPTCI